MSKSEVVVAIHACTGTAGRVHIGGLDKELANLIARELEDRGVSVSNDHPRFQGSNPDNICNRGATGIGVQLEVTRDLRDDLEKVKVIARAVRAALLNFRVSNCYSSKNSVLYPNPDKPEITNYKHHLILKLGQINSKLQYQNLK